MRIFSTMVVFASVLASMMAGAQEPEAAAVRFEAVDVYIDSAEVIVALIGVAGPISGLPRGTHLGYTPLNAVKDVDT